MTASRVAGAPTNPAVEAVLDIERRWRLGEEPELESHWTQSGSGGDPDVLAALVKTDLRRRFARGERPEVAEYLDRFPALRDRHERVISLVYEEFCLRE